jgi:hypothetical protein
MKQYFLEYIEFPGSIQVGDLIPFDNEVSPKRVDKIEDDYLYIDLDSGYPSDMLKYEISKFKKVKLCVCSRDIKIGDKNLYMYCRKNNYLISNHKGVHFEKILPNGRAWLVWEKGTASAEYPFVHKLEPDYYGFTSDIYKVLGEVSEHALGYVNHKQEFNVDDLAYISDEDNSFQSLTDILKLAEESNEQLPSGIYAIKGPCNHFH